MATQEEKQLNLLQAPDSPFTYLRRDPEKSFLYQTIRDNWLTFQAEAERSGRELPFYVIREFEEFLKCGVLAHGFVRLKCEKCKHEKLVAFSCKKRGFCPSCAGRKQAMTGAFLASHVFPPWVSVRQWVISFPVPLRYWQAANPKLMNAVLGIVTRAISGFYRNGAASRGDQGGQTGSVTLVQRFGDALRLNVHYHQIWIEGVFVKPKDKNRPSYRWTPSPTDKDVMDMLATIRTRVVRLLVRRGYLKSDETPTGEATDNFESDEPLLASVMAASTQGMIATGERAGQRVRKVGSFGIAGETPVLTGPLCASVGGFSLHANTFIGWGQPEKLEKLCRYISRPPVASDRLYRTKDGDIGYMLKSQWNDGTYAVKFSPMEFIEKLVALIPQPRIHLTRHYGVLAPHHAWRAEIVPAVKTGEVLPVSGEELQKPKCSARQRMSWSELLKRVFHFDLATCPDCGGTVKFIAAVMKRDVVVKILDHLNLPSAIPEWAPARGPPCLTFDF